MKYPMSTKLRLLPALIGALLATSAFGASHREAPLITETPKVDATDFYIFRSYESNRSGFVTLIANYIPLQDPYGGPNFFSMDPKAVYEIHIDNNGDAVEDLSFQFRFTNSYQNLAIPVGGQSIAVPLVNIGSFGPTVTANEGVKNLIETYTLSTVRGARGNSGSDQVQNIAGGGFTFRKPSDNIGGKSIPDYATYADNHIYPIAMGGCGEGRVFVGQRKEAFVANLGEIFDLINTNPLGPVNGEENVLDDKNVTSIALELPIACLTAGNNSPIIGAWTTASVAKPQLSNSADFRRRTPNTAGTMTQLSRLGAPLVNEVVIGLPDKDKFNASEPKDDAQFAKYVTNPTLPELIEILFAAPAPNVFPRTDLVAAFLTGVEGLNKPANVTASEMLRLNTSIAAVPAASQNVLGVIGGDNAGFPNGRRPGDDVVDIALRVMMGKLLTVAQAPAGQLPLTDGALSNANDYRSTFPYLNTPLNASPN